MMAFAEGVLFLNLNLCSRTPGDFKRLSTFRFHREIVFDRCLMLSTSIGNEFLRQRPPSEVVYLRDDSPMSFWLMEARLTPSLGVLLHPTNEHGNA